MFLIAEIVIITPQTSAKMPSTAKFTLYTRKRLISTNSVIRQSSALSSASALITAEPMLL